MGAKKSFKECNDELNRRFTNDNWSKLMTSKGITLLMGAGVSSCLVGNWNELLNELAILRVASESEGVSIPQVSDYLDKYCHSMFLPEDTSALEKGEYLRYCITDRIMFDSKEKSGKWREIVFAGRVAIAVRRLIKRHLCDGAGKETESDYKTDFLNWCNNAETEPFSFGRRELSHSDKTEIALEKFSSDEIAKKLNSHYGIRIDTVKLKSVIEYGTEKVDEIYRMFDPGYSSRSCGDCRKRIKAILKHKNMSGKTKDERINIFLRKIAAYLLWRPSYETLETMLSMCINRKVSNVITYNFDTIFERLLIDERVQRALYNSVNPFEYLHVRVYGIKTNEPLDLIGCGKEEHSEVLCVHHVHGIVDDEMEKPEPIIFSETSYLSYQQLSLNIGSMQIADAYYKGSLLCVGFSGVDPNFRSVIRQMNLLKNAPVFDDGKKHEILLTRSLKEIRRYYGINEEMEADDYGPAFLCACTYLEMLRQYYKNATKVKLLWSSDYEDMNDKLKKMFGL